MEWGFDPLEYFSRLPRSEVYFLLHPIMAGWKLFHFLVVGLTALLQVIVLDFVLFESAQSIVVL